MNLFAGKYWGTEKILRTIAKYFRNVEFVFDKPYFWLKDLELARMAEIKSFLKQRNLKIVDVSTCTAGGYERPDDDYAPPGQRFGPSFADADKNRRELRIKHAKKVIDYAIILDCYDINTSTGYQPKDRSHKESWADVVKCYREIAKYAKKYGAWINIEYEPGEYGPGGLFIANLKDTLKMINAIGMDNVGVNLDLGHALVCGEDPCKSIEICAKEGVLKHIHLEDIKGNRHFHLVPGDGDMDFQSIFETLLAVDYKGCVTLELYSLWDQKPAQQAKRAHKYLLENFGQFLKTGAKNEL